MLSFSRIRDLTATAAVLMTGLASTTWVHAVTPSIYQCQLDLNDSRVADLCEIRFSLSDAASDGTQIGSTISKMINIVNGLLTTQRLPFQIGANS